MKKHYILFIMTLHPLLTSCRKKITLQQLHSVHQISTPPPLPSKTPPPSFFPSPPLNMQTVQAPSPFFLGNTPSILVFQESPLPPYMSDFSVNAHTKFSPLTPSYLLKVTKLLLKISQFEFLVMTEKNIFVYKLFLSSNASDFRGCTL